MRCAALFLAILTIIGTTSCEKRNPDSVPVDSALVSDVPPVDFDFDKIKERGVLRAIIDNTSTSYFIYKGQPMGYEYELLTRFAASHGLRLELVLSPDLEEIFNMLNRGEGDIIAYNLTVTKSRSERVAFTTHHSLARQVLVQRKPDNWRDMRLHRIEAGLIRDPVDLVDKTVVVRRKSAFVTRLENLSEEIGGEIRIVEDDASVRSEELIGKVANGEVDLTIADENVALINATYYPVLDVETPVSFSQKIAWAVRKNSPQLLETIDQWIARMKRTPDFNVIYNKYYRAPKEYLERASSGFVAATDGQLSEYDDLIKVAADSIDWDWRLLGALIYRESKFDPRARSWVGAQGLMQLMPRTAKEYGVRDPFDPVQNIRGGTAHLTWLENYWSDKIIDSLERHKFVLASYNVGQGHILDAQRLTEKYSRNPLVWDDNVAYFLLQKSRPEYYKDPVVRHGYCRGEEPFNYVKEIYQLYEQYKTALKSPEF